jgi:protein tyrosine phosphatase (PTP) superfamily phosphohydrolase (DUF442 family)
MKLILNLIFLMSISLISEGFEKEWPPNCAKRVLRFIQVHPHLYRGGQPKDLEDLKCIQSVGIKTVISLINESPETVQWEREQTAELGIGFYSFPMSGILSPQTAQIIRIFRELLEPFRFPIYIHCMHGKDRTGLLMGLYRVWLDQWTPKEAWSEMVKIGFDFRLFGLTFYFWNESKKPMPNLVSASFDIQ